VLSQVSDLNFRPINCGLTWVDFISAYGWTGKCQLSPTNAFSPGGPATVTIVSLSKDLEIYGNA
jgi:hypothetical protein